MNPTFGLYNRDNKRTRFRRLRLPNQEKVVRVVDADDYCPISAKAIRKMDELANTRLTHERLGLKRKK